MTQVAVIHSAFSDKHNPHVVAFVEAGERTGTEALEYAYRVTQNIEGSWSKGPTFEWEGETHTNPDFNPDITVMVPLTLTPEGKEYGLRSTSMGDQMLLGTDKYEVAAFGFDKL